MPDLKEIGDLSEHAPLGPDPLLQGVTLRKLSPEHLHGPGSLHGSRSDDSGLGASVSGMWKVNSVQGKRSHANEEPFPEYGNRPRLEDKLDTEVNVTSSMSGSLKE
ncbi:uncharacterized protein [Antedon mediterranea]|uniref:uncharacterized protein n=1 Tax=Antedon mediterranea TaxID=105859 RepID=UPI003AF8DCE8